MLREGPKKWQKTKKKKKKKKKKERNVWAWKTEDKILNIQVYVEKAIARYLIKQGQKHIIIQFYGIIIYKNPSVYKNSGMSVGFYVQMLPSRVSIHFYSSNQLLKSDCPNLY